MRKSTIWLLTVVIWHLLLADCSSQVKYVSIILKKSSEQFNETVKRCALQVSKNLELDETRKYLEDISRDEANNYLYQNNQNELNQVVSEEQYVHQYTDSNGNIHQIGNAK